METILTICFGMCLAAGGAAVGAINNKQKRLIMDMNELKAALQAALATIEAQNAKIETLTVGLAKIGTETDASLAAITRLEEAIAGQSGVPVEVAAAAEALIVAIGKQTDAVSAAQAALTAVDEKVPDAPTPPTPSES